MQLKFSFVTLTIFFIRYVFAAHYFVDFERVSCSVESGEATINFCYIKNWNRTFRSIEINTKFEPTRYLKVNISNTWTLPQEGFSVFYRFFRDKISWFEADAVCQFHHANLVTVENGVEFDATRAFLKELDVTEPVWIGLMRPQNSQRFIWTNTKPLDTSSGYWAESIPVLESPLCSVIDPVRDFRWHALRCGGPETAAFLCEMNLPDWAQECTVSSLPSLTVQYMSDSGTIQLSRDCGEEGTRHILCKGKQDRNIILKELVCLDESKEATVSDNIVIETTTDSGRKLPAELLTPLNEVDDNHIHLVQENNHLDLNMMNTNKIYDNMQGDQPFKSEEDMRDDDLKKKVEPNAKKSTNIYKKKGKADKKSKDSEEMMMGDQPVHHLPNVEEVPADIQPESSELEILPHEKKMLPQDLKTPEKIKKSLTPLTVATESSEIIGPMISADTTIVSQSTTIPTSDKSEIDTETDGFGKQTTYITSTTTMISTTQDQRQRRRSEVDLESTTVELYSTTENSIPSTTTEVTQETSPDDVERTSDVEVTSTTTTTTEVPVTSTTLQPMTTNSQKINLHEDGRYGSGHPIHIPKNILIKNDLTTTSSPFASSTSHPIPKPTQRRDLSEEHFIPPMLLVKAQFTSTKSHDVATTLASVLNSETSTKLVTSTSLASITTDEILNGSEPTEVIVNEKSYSVVENGSVVDVVELSEKVNQTEQSTTIGSILISSTEAESVTTHLPSSTEEIPINSTIDAAITSEKLITENNAAVTTSNHDQLKSNDIILHATAVDLAYNSINNEHSDDEHNDHLNMTDHEKFNENKFSNVENYQPYRPNRHRSLTKPETQSMIKKILG